MTQETLRHQPVLLNEVVEALRPEPGKWYLDGTLGAGGHSEAILNASAPSGKLIGMDLDPNAIEMAAKRLAKFGERVKIIRGSYAFADRYITSCFDNITGFDGILLDLGISSMQVDAAEKGFSFQKEGPLDMRFDPNQKTSAYDLVNFASEEELSRIFWEYGEERAARRIAAAICSARVREPIETTTMLAEIVANAVHTNRKSKNNPATKSFQALRIAVNNELETIEKALPVLIALLKPGGRLAVISFHSLEDRIVKNFFRIESTDCLCPPEQVVCTCGHKASLKRINRHAITAKDDEIRENPRARSAKLRVVEKIGTEK